MRVLFVIFLSLVAMASFATLPEYFSSRQWIEQHTPKSQTLQDERVFVGDSIATTNTYIFHFHTGILLREVIDSTPYKGSDVDVIVLRSEHKTGPVFFEVVKRNEKPKFELKTNDVIWIAPKGTPTAAAKKIIWPASVSPTLSPDANFSIHPPIVSHGFRPAIFPSPGPVSFPAQSNLCPSTATV
jgi:hypothetical protein